MIELKKCGVTTLFTKEVSKLVGPEVDFSDTPITVVMENFLFLRFVELRSHLHRVLSVLKMRDSPYVAELREFSFSESGFRVLAPLASAEGLLTGLAREVSSKGDRSVGGQR
jgi:circadian clock protein KaiC